MAAMSTRSRSSVSLSLTSEIQSGLSGWAGQVEKGIFGSFAVLAESKNSGGYPVSPLQIYLEVLGIIIDALQLVGIVVGSDFRWPEQYFSWASRFLNLIELLLPKHVFPIVFGLVMAFVWSGIIDAAYCTWAFSQGTHRAIWPIVMLQVVWVFLGSVAFIPILELNIRAAVDPKEAFSAVDMSDGTAGFIAAGAVITASLLVPYCVLFSLLYYDSNPRSLSPGAKPSGRVSLLDTVLRACFVILSQVVLVPSTRWFVSLLFTVSTGAMAYQMYRLPHYKLWVDQLRCAAYMGIAWLSLASFILSIVAAYKSQDTADQVAFDFTWRWLACTPIPVVVGAILPAYRAYNLREEAKLVLALHFGGSQYRHEVLQSSTSSSVALGQCTMDCMEATAHGLSRCTRSSVGLCTSLCCACCSGGNDARSVRVHPTLEGLTYGDILRSNDRPGGSLSFQDIVEATYADEYRRHSLSVSTKQALSNERRTAGQHIRRTSVAGGGIAVSTNPAGFKEGPGSHPSFLTDTAHVVGSADSLYLARAQALPQGLGPIVSVSMGESPNPDEHAAIPVDSKSGDDRAEPEAKLVVQSAANSRLAPEGPPSEEAKRSSDNGSETHSTAERGGSFISNVSADATHQPAGPDYKGLLQAGAASERRTSVEHEKPVLTTESAGRSNLKTAKSLRKGSARKSTGSSALKRVGFRGRSSGSGSIGGSFRPQRGLAHQPSFNFKSGVELDEGRPTIYSEYDVERMARAVVISGPTKENLNAALHVYAVGMREHPESAYVRVCYAAFLESYHYDQLRGMSMLRAASKIKAPLDVRFLIFNRAKLAEQFRHSSQIGESISTIGVIEYKKLLADATRKHYRAVFYLTKLWDVCKRRLQTAGSIDVSDAAHISKRLRQFQSLRDGATKSYAYLLRKYPNAQAVLRSYGTFVLDVLNRPDAADAYFARADELEEDESRVEAGGKAERESQADRRTESRFSKAHSHATMSTSTGSGLTVLPRKEFLIKSDDSDAVFGMALGVQRGLSALGMLSFVVFGILIFMLTHFQGNIDATYKASKRRALIEQGAFFTRRLQLASQEYNGSVAEESRQRLSFISEELHDIHTYLHGKQKFESVVEFMQDRNLDVLELVSGPAIAELQFENATLSPYDGIMFYISVLRHVHSLEDDGFQWPSHIRTNPDWRFVMDNVLGSIMEAMQHSVQLYQSMDFVVADQFHYIYIAIFVLMLLLVAYLGLGVYYPAASRVANTKVGVVDIAKSLRSRSIRRLHKYFSKAYKRLNGADQDTASESDMSSDSDSDGGDGAGLADTAAGAISRKSSFAFGKRYLALSMDVEDPEAAMGDTISKDTSMRNSSMPRGAASGGDSPVAGSLRPNRQRVTLGLHYVHHIERQTSSDASEERSMPRIGLPLTEEALDLHQGAIQEIEQKSLASGSRPASKQSMEGSSTSHNGSSEDTEGDDATTSSSSTGAESRSRENVKQDSDGNQATRVPASDEHDGDDSDAGSDQSEPRANAASRTLERTLDPSKATPTSGDRSAGAGQDATSEGVETPAGKSGPLEYRRIGRELIRAQRSKRGLVHATPEQAQRAIQLIGSASPSATAGKHTPGEFKPKMRSSLGLDNSRHTVNGSGGVSRFPSHPQSSADHPEDQVALSNTVARAVGKKNVLDEELPVGGRKAPADGGAAGQQRPSTSAHQSIALVQALSIRVAFVLLLIAGLQSIVFYTSYHTIELAKLEAAEISASGELAFRVRESAFVAYESLIGDGEFHPDQCDLSHLLQHNLHELDELSHGLRFGDASRKLKGSDYRHGPQTLLQYGEGNGPASSSAGVGDITGLLAQGGRHAAAGQYLLEDMVQQDGFVAALVHFVEFGKRLATLVRQGERRLGFECPDWSPILDEAASRRQLIGLPTSLIDLELVQGGADTTEPVARRLVGGSMLDHVMPDDTALRGGRDYLIGHNRSMLARHPLLGYLLAGSMGPVGKAADRSMELYLEESAENVQRELLTIGLVLAGNLMVLLLVYFMALQGMIQRLVDESRLNHTFLDILPLRLIRRSRPLQRFYIREEDDDQMGEQ